MTRFRFGSLLVAALLCAGVRPVLAQRPTTAQAQEILRTRPDLVAQLRQRLGTSGLTPDQVRARLRAEGYPENLLDPYLADAGSATSPGVPNATVLEAARALGITDSTDTDLMPPRVAPAERDIPVAYDTVSARRALHADSLRTSADTAASDSLRRRVQLTSRFMRDSGYTIFGLNVFQGASTQFEANAAGPVDANYRLGPGDRLVLILTGDVELAHTLDVTREGFVVIPQVGQLYVANLTMAELEDVLYTRLGRVYSGVRRGAGATTRFSVSVARLRSNQVFVVGDVVNPGSYRVSSAGTALTALYAAGGPSTSGSLRNIEVRRAGAVVSTLDVYDYLLRGDASHDVRLGNGDIVFVPPYRSRVRVIGEVLRPATYEIKAGETLADVIRAAGGFTAYAARQRVQIERILPGTDRANPGRDRVVIDVSSSATTGEAVPNVAVEAGDVVRVFAIADRVRNRVSIEGNVWLPGAQGFSRGMTLADALTRAGGIKPDTYLGQVLISRLRPDSTRIQLRTSLRDSTGTPSENVPLAEDDQVTVYSVTEFRPVRYVAIAGAVRKGGRFPYRDGMTLRDLVLLAGGLEESAYLKEAEVARLPENRAAGVTAMTFRVPLDSTYLFERSGTEQHPYLGPPGLAAPAAGAPEVALRPYDNVMIMRQPDWELQRTVVLAGEVKYPGAYALMSKTERLSEVIRRAGGLTAEGYAGGVVFYRKRNGVGRIGVDLPAVLKKSSVRDNLVLQDGDSILIPRYNGVVTVAGAVNSPVAVAYVPGRDLNYYISAAGGFSRKADGGRAYVTQPNGKVESGRRALGFGASKPKPGPGSTVFVPEKDPNEKRDYVAAVAAVAQILASLVAVLVVVKR
jgi:protein involved in polysaccharide export with SLBB domain